MPSVLLGTFAALALLGAWEALLRTAWEDPYERLHLWTWLERREAVLESAEPPLVIVGASRAQRLQPSVLEKELNRPVISLALEGESPLPVIADLAAADTFRGWILASVVPVTWFNDRDEPGRVSSYLRIGRGGWKPSDAGRTKRELRKTIRFLSPEFSPHFLLEQVSEGYSMNPNRRREQLPEAVIQAGGLSTKKFRPLSDESWRRRFDELARQARALEARGGGLILLRMPVGHLRAAKEMERAPRHLGWDRLVRELGVPAIHYADHASLSGFETPDGSHIRMEDRSEFSRALARVLAPVLERPEEARHGDP